MAFHCCRCVPSMNGRRTSWYGNWFCRNMSFRTTAVGSRAMAARSCGVAVINSGRKVSYMPPGDRKSGMPAAQLTPAPVNTTTFWHASLARYAATPLTSREASRIAATRAAPMTSSARMVVALPLSSALLACILLRSRNACKSDWSQAGRVTERRIMNAARVRVSLCLFFSAFLPRAASDASVSTDASASALHFCGACVQLCLLR